jgi:hypothetical protein
MIIFQTSIRSSPKIFSDLALELFDLSLVSVNVSSWNASQPSMVTALLATLEDLATSPRGFDMKAKNARS